MDLFLGTIVIWPISWVPEGFATCDGSLINVSQNQALYSLMGNTYGGVDDSTFGLPDLRGRVPVGSGIASTGTVYPFSKPGGLEKVDVIFQVPGIPATGKFNGNAFGTIKLTPAQLPAHSHDLEAVTIPISIPANTAGGTTDTPGNTTILAKGTVVGGPVNTTAKSYSTANANASLESFDVTIPAATTQPAGASQGIPITLSVNALVDTMSSDGVAEGTVPLMQPYLGLIYMICVNGYYPPRP